VNEVKVTYHDVEITYNEVTDKWLFTLRGREKEAVSLKEAKATIDKPVSKPKGKPFERVKAVYGSRLDPVEITSIAAKSSYRSYGTKDEVRIKHLSKGKFHAEGEIAKAAAELCYPLGPDNDSIIFKIGGLIADRDELDKRIDEAFNLLTPYKVPDEE